jgi:hypothetical protein
MNPFTRRIQLVAVGQGCHVLVKCAEFEGAKIWPKTIVWRYQQHKQMDALVSLRKCDSDSIYTSMGGCIFKLSNATSYQSPAQSLLGLSSFVPF